MSKYPEVDVPEGTPELRFQDIRKPDSEWDYYPDSDDDFRVGDVISYVVGDTFLNFHDVSPRDQWIRIAKILRVHGLAIRPRP